MSKIISVDNSENQPSLEARNITVIKNTKKILDDVSLKIKTGELVAIIGFTGSGKSTLMKVLAGKEKPASGDVVLRNIPHYDAVFPGALIGYLHQENDALPDELSVNAALDLTTQIRVPFLFPNDRVQRLKNLLDKMNVSDCWGKTVKNLSGGERRRINLCAERITNPLFLMLDEPTSSLDCFTSINLWQDIRSLVDEKHTVIVVTHDSINYELCDRIFFILNGKLALEGTPDDIRRFMEINDFLDVYRKLDKIEDEYGRKMLSKIHSASLSSASTGMVFSDVLQNDAKPIKLTWRQKLNNWVESTVSRFLPKKNKALSTGKPTEHYRTISELWETSFGSIWKQFLAVLYRSVAIQFTDPIATFFILIQPIIAGILFLLIAPSDIFSIVQKNGDYPIPLFVISILVTLIGLINSYRQIIGEKQIFYKEQMAGLFPLAFLAAKLVFLYMLALLQISIMLGIIGLGIRFPEHGWIISISVIEIGISLFFCAIASIGTGLIVSLLVKTLDQATGIIVILLSILIVFSIYPSDGTDEISKFINKRIQSNMPTTLVMNAIGTTVDFNLMHRANNRGDVMTKISGERLSQFGLASSSSSRANECILEKLNSMPDDKRTIERVKPIITDCQLTEFKNENSYKQEMSSHLDTIWDKFSWINLLQIVFLSASLLIQQNRILPRHIKVQILNNQ